jgi:hypothetical protein
MPKHLSILIAITFVVGIISGVYVYFLTRGESNEPLEDPQAESVYEVIVTTYGGCELLGCSSIRFLDDGSYVYLVSDGSDSFKRYEDVISKRQSEELALRIDETPFKKLMKTTYDGTCPSAYDGLAYRFTIRYKEEVYDLDSCVQDLEGQPLFAELIQYFAIMNATHLEQ